MNKLKDKNYTGYKETVEYVKRNGDQMTDLSPAARKDYERLVNSNPQNVMGAPAFFPPMEILSVPTSTNHDCTGGHRWSNTIHKFCTRCFIDKPQEG